MRFYGRLESSIKFSRNLDAIQTAVHTQGNLSSWNGGQKLLARTKAVVPYKDGDLYNSAFLEKDEETERGVSAWIVGYDLHRAPYAVLVHELPNRNHPTRGPSKEPKQDHFLSEPADAMRKEYPRTVADDMERAIRRVRLMR